MAFADLKKTVMTMVKLAVGDKLPMRQKVIEELRKEKPPLDLDMGLYGQATNDAKKMLAELKNPPVAKTLDSPLVDLFIAGSMDKTMYRYDKKLMGDIKKSTGYTPPQERDIQKLCTVLAQIEHQGRLAQTGAGGISIRDFLKLGHDGQIKCINALWGECTVPGAYNTETKDMCEADNEVIQRGTSQLPSSIYPVRSGAVVKTFSAGRSDKPFTELGVGFRVEGSFDTRKGETIEKVSRDIKRVSTAGMVPQVTLDWLMLDMGKDVEGTTISIDVQLPRLNIAQLDLWNESGICVARSFFGSTAFPLRDFVGGAVMWAVNVGGLGGMDTEAWQLSQPAVGDGPWRSGEKCYRRIMPQRILGYVIIDKLGDVGGGWKVSVRPGAKWTYVNYPPPAQTKYLEEVMAAWAGVTAEVPTDFDFQAATVEQK